VAILTATACTVRTEVQGPIRPVRAQTSWVLAADGTPLTSLHAEEDRQDVALGEVPEHVRHAVVAIEDERFFTHGGIDLQAMVRAALRNVSEGQVAEGGSTITQQYVKNVLLDDDDRTVKRKLREASLAIQLENRNTKDRILELYLNTIYFGNGAYGVEAAAREYFGATTSDLTLPQGALLAALIQAPNATDPYREPDAALRRRNLVLDKMVELDAISLEEAAAAASTPLELSSKPPEQRYPAAHFVEQVKRLILDNEQFGATREERERLLFTGGIRVHTTIDLDLQRQAEEAVAKVLSEPERDPEAALVAMEPRTGFVRALVGGRDFFGPAEHAKFDLATQKGRPAGSSFKPLVLATAVDRGFPLDEPYPAPAALTLSTDTGPWRVENYGAQDGGSANLVEATVRSYNTVYAQLMQQVGPADAVEMAHRLGITSPLVNYPSTVLGVNDVTPLEMASAFGTFAARGIHVAPVLVTRILDADGSILYQHERDPERVLRQPVADQVTDILRQVIERGTGTTAKIGRPAAGKTGTGQDWTDAWFVGFTPELVSSVWVGFPEAQVPMVPPRTRIRVTGGSWPAQIWQLFMSAALADRPVTELPQPPSELELLGAELVVIRDVIGFRFEAAQDLLERDGWTVERNDVPSSDYPPGIVVAQTPTAGEEAPKGSTIILDVSDGRAEIAAVPDSLDALSEDAAREIRLAGFTPEVRVELEPESAGGAARAGRVWKQSPAAGTILRLGATVIVWVNPEEVPEPGG
jgi:penicillin-binding protein 1A